LLVEDLLLVKLRSNGALLQ
jgi:hypothetical protein